MPSFRRKPITVEAVKFVKAELLARAQGRAAGGLDLETGVAIVNGIPQVLTRDGLVGVVDGDWIVIYQDGQQEVWRPSTFAAMWEQVLP